MVIVVDLVLGEGHRLEDVTGVARSAMEDVGQVRHGFRDARPAYPDAAPVA